ncbi:MAG: glycosyltransferase [Paludibacteraceae bacterium]|nr:glycosyltransferase [Paludibacteraceae bacterium]
MKVIILGTAHPYRGGLATFNERLARQFVSEGHEVELWTFTLQYPSFLFPGKTQYTSEPAPTDLLIRRELNSCNPFNWCRVGRAIRKATPDLLICCYWMSFFAPSYGLISRMARKNGKTRCVALVHNMIPHEPNILDKLFAPYFVKSQDAFVALSESVLKDIEKIENKIINHKSSIINRPKVSSPHPIYDHYGERMAKAAACKALNLPGDKQYMLFFGLVRAYKGLDLLLDAFGMVKDQLPDLQLIIAGEFYEHEDKYRAQIASLGMTDRVIIRNEFIPDDDLRKYFGAADLIVQPYKTATQSGVTQVAFHFEKPMLVTNVGGLGEIVHDHQMGYACEQKPEAIAADLLDYYQNNRQKAYTTYLKKEKTKYAWSNMTEAYINILSQC